MTTNWLIKKLECKVSENGLSNVVYKIHWVYQVISIINGKKYHSTKLGITSIPGPDSLSFTSYENLTKEQVVGWLIDVLEEANISSMTNHLHNQNILKANPITVILDPPFNS